MPTFRYKMLAITISGGLGALSGAVAALQIGYLTPDGVFNLTVPLLVVVMSVLGGRRHWLGPVIGAVVIYSLQERLTNSGLGEWGPVVLGSILVLMILFAPEGLFERMRDRPRRAVAAGVTLVVATTVAGLVGWGIATDWLSTGLIAATLVLLAGRPPRRSRHAQPRACDAPASRERRREMSSTDARAPTTSSEPVLECVESPSASAGSAHSPACRSRSRAARS